MSFFLPRITNVFLKYDIFQDMSIVLSGSSSLSWGIIHLCHVSVVIRWGEIGIRLINISCKVLSLISMLLSKSNVWNQVPENSQRPPSSPHSLPPLKKARLLKGLGGCNVIWEILALHFLVDNRYSSKNLSFSCHLQAWRPRWTIRGGAAGLWGFLDTSWINLLCYHDTTVEQERRECIPSQLVWLIYISLYHRGGSPGIPPV